MREGKRYLSLFLAAAITVTGVNVGSAFQANAANNGTVRASEWRLLTPGDVTSSDGKTELTAKIQEIENEKLNQNGYTADTWQALADALANAKTVNEDVNATKVQRVDALNALIEARNNLKVSPDDGQEVSKETLNNKITEAEGKDQNKYTPATWAALQTALEAAKGVYNNADATQAQINEAYTKLVNAINGLKPVTPDEGQEVNKKALNDKIAEANQKVEKDYTPATWAKLQEALTAARTVAGNANATQAEVNKALADLNAAINGLKPVTPDEGQEVDKTALKKRIAEVKAAQATYTPASWTAFKPALDAAEAVAAKADATQAEVNKALADLNAAIAKLVKVANKTALKAEIAKVAALRQADYTSASWTNLQTVLATARAVDANANATQAQVDQARTNLTTAINGLVKVANKANLKKSIDAANRLKKAAYTSASWKTFNTALTNAKNVYNNANATQAQVNAAKKKLDDAKKALKKVVTKVTITNGKSLKIAAGKKVTLKTTVAPKDAANKKVKWSISKKDKKYASVNSKGVVTTKKAGAGKTVAVTATAADGSKEKSTIKISIMKNAVTKITLKANSKTVKAGKKVTVKATVKTNGKKANKTLAWKSSNTKYATVSSKGVVTTKKAGKGKTVTITAAATDGSGKKGTIKILFFTT